MKERKIKFFFKKTYHQKNSIITIKQHNPLYQIPFKVRIKGQKKRKKLEILKKEYNKPVARHYEGK